MENQPQISIQINNYVDPLNSTIQHPNQIYSPNNISPNQLTPVNTPSYPPSFEDDNTSPSEDNNTTSSENDTSSSTSSKTNMLPNDDENDICAICLENIDLEKNDSISSCSCKNKLHIECLIKWIEYKDSIYCEICRSQYNIPHHVLLQYYNQQLLNIENQQSSNINNPDSNDYYLNTYNNSNDNNNAEDDDSDLSDDSYDVESTNYNRDRRLYNEIINLHRRRDCLLTIYCLLLAIFMSGITILMYDIIYIKK